MTDTWLKLTQIEKTGSRGSQPSAKHELHQSLVFQTFTEGV